MNKPIYFKIYNSHVTYNANTPNLEGGVILVKDEKKLIVDGVEFKQGITEESLNNYTTKVDFNQLKENVSNVEDRVNTLENKRDKYLSNVSITGSKKKTITFSFSDSSQLSAQFDDLEGVNTVYDDTILRNKIGVIEQNLSQAQEKQEKIKEIAKSAIDKANENVNNFNNYYTKTEIDNKFQWEVFD